MERTPLLTLRQVADYIQVSLRTVYNLVDRPHDPLPTLKIGGQRRVRPEDLDAWLDRQEAA